jgi:hypothetical protein
MQTKNAGPLGLKLPKTAKSRQDLLFILFESVPTRYNGRIDGPNGLVRFFREDESTLLRCFDAFGLFEDRSLSRVAKGQPSRLPSGEPWPSLSAPL